MILELTKKETDFLIGFLEANYDFDFSDSEKNLHRSIVEKLCNKSFDMKTARKVLEKKRGKAI